MTTKTPVASPWRSRRPLPYLLALLAALSLTACDLDGLLEVTDPDVNAPGQIRDPSNLGALRTSALGEFMIGYAGNSLGGGRTEGIVLSAGLLADEMYVGDTFGTRQEVDRRRITPQNADLTRVFRNLHRARRAAELADELFTQYEGNPVQHAEVTSLIGYTYTIFAENYCSGVPFSYLRYEDDVVQPGPQRTTQEMYEHALGRFRDAQELTANATQVNLARIGEARVLLGLGRFQDAANAVVAVPTGYLYELQYSTNTERQNNGVWALTHDRRGYGVAHQEGGNGLPFRQGNSQQRASQDPRVPYTRTNQRATDSPFAFFRQLKYPERGSSMPLASGIEARLIEAEAALRRNDLATFVAKHNELRATQSGLDAFALAEVSAMTPDQRVDVHFRERAFWLYLTAHRLSDLRRLIRQYGRDSETVFPTGVYGRLAYAGASVPDDELVFRAQTTYGTDVNFPVPFDEQNNPNFQQCIDRDA
jgi:starch-binding outer membrane protein, SusD/RagB family